MSTGHIVTGKPGVVDRRCVYSDRVPEDESTSWSPVTLTITAVIVIAACVALGRWQLTRVYRPADGYSSEPAAVSLSALVPRGGIVPPADAARQVTVTGHYLAAAQTTEPGHTLAGQAVDWVVTPLIVADGATVPIVRGWVSGPGQNLATPPAGTVSVTARLERGQLPNSASTPGSATGWLSAGYLVRTAQTPPDPLSLQPVPEAPPPSDAPAEFHLQNAIYVGQWWLLSLFVLVAWWRLVHAARRVPDRAEPIPAMEHG
jgi:cytochrome oxidase assembly protein ShyY1